MASPFDLATLAQVKAWLGPSSSVSSASDAVLGPLVTSASRSVLGYLSRGAILPQTITERRDGGGASRMLLREWPVLSVSSVLVDGQTLTAAAAPSASAPYPAGFLLEPWTGIPPGQMQGLDLFSSATGSGRFTRGRQNVTLTYQAGYAVQGETWGLPGVSPYTVTAAAPYGPWASDLGVAYASSGLALTKVTGAPAAGQYAVANGVYTFAAADAGGAVAISYGFIPQDLQQAAIELVAEQFAYSTRTGQVSKSLGGQETTAFSQRELPRPLALRLQPYRRVAMPD